MSTCTVPGGLHGIPFMLHQPEKHSPGFTEEKKIGLYDECSHHRSDILLHKRAPKGSNTANNLNVPDLKKLGNLLIVVQEHQCTKDFYKPRACCTHRKCANASGEAAESNRQALHGHA